ncbi:MAG TPA: hypothetical protein VMD79_10295 [Solirubrobacteraceae bacterium]|nr:hypothetical protein [Solirubrobacteraceae bacterium]
MLAGDDRLAEHALADLAGAPAIDSVDARKNLSQTSAAAMSGKPDI